MLNGYRGIVVADGCGAYDELARASPSLTLAHCWAHVRRRFVRGEGSLSGLGARRCWSSSASSSAVERACPAVEVGTSEDARAEALAIRATARLEQSAPIIAAIHA